MDKIILIILIGLNVLLIIPFIMVGIKNSQLKQAFQRTVYYVKVKLGFIISVNGDIRLGKTSSMSGLSSICQILITQDIKDLIQKTVDIFQHINFNEVNKIITTYYDLFSFSSKEDYPDFELITDHVLKEFDLDPDSYVNNFIGNTKTYKMIFDYCQAIFVFYYRNNYVQSKTKFYSHITGNYNLDLNVNWLKIREAYQNKDYAINDWIVILIDEITDEAASAEWQSDLKDKSGAKEYRRKFGQIHQERNRIITTKQDVLDEIKKFRNLTHSNLVLDDKVSTTGNYYWIHKATKKVLNIYLFLHKHIYVRLFKFWFKKTGLKFQQFYDLYVNELGIIRKINNFLYYLKEFLTSIGYNRYYGRNLRRPEDIERINTEAEEFYFYIPTIYCFGTYDTHYFKTMQQDLIKNSNTVTRVVKPQKDEHFFDNLINEDKGDDNFEF